MVAVVNNFGCYPGPPARSISLPSPKTSILTGSSNTIGELRFIGAARSEAIDPAPIVNWAVADVLTQCTTIMPGIRIMDHKFPAERLIISKPFFRISSDSGRNRDQAAQYHQWNDDLHDTLHD